MFRFLITFCWILLGVMPASLYARPTQPAPGSEGSVELHAHLFMKQGMTWAFRGDFNEPLQATDWQDRFSSQANPEALEKSGIRILVVALYAHPLFVLSLKESIRRQIEMTEEFVATHPQWVIALDPRQARAALSQGQRVLIFSLEGAAGILENEEDFAEFIDRRGIRIVTPLHLTDDQFGGVALLHGIRGLSSPFAWLKAVIGGNRADGVLTNPSGLTTKGQEWIRKLIEHRAWVDLAHSSDASQREIIPELRQNGLPLLYTHTILRQYHQAERGITDWQLAEVARSGGIIGLMPSEEMLAGTPAPDGIHALAMQYRQIAQTIGASSVMMGSDYNGGLPHLKPSAGTRSAMDQQGLWNIGQVPDLWRALTNLEPSVPKPLNEMVESFLRAWERVLPATKHYPNINK